MGKTNERIRNEIIEELKRDRTQSLRELAEKVGVVSTTVNYHIRVLERRGLIERDPNKHRSFKVV